MPRGRVLAAALSVLIAAVAAFCAPAGAASEPHLRVGSLVLKPCGDVAGWWCGSLPRPLDPARPHGPHIGIGFRWRPAGGGKAGGPPLVAVEGGPGYPSTGSRVEYTGIYGPLLETRGKRGKAPVLAAMVELLRGGKVVARRNKGLRDASARVR